MARRDPAAAARAAMPERYGRPSPSGRLLLAGLVVALVGAGGWWLVDAAVEGSTPEVAAGVAAYDVRSAHRTDVTVEVRRSVETAVQCDVFAQAADKAVVGERGLRLPERPAGTEQVTVQIVTERLATTAGVRGCRPSSSAP